MEPKRPATVFTEAVWKQTDSEWELVISKNENAD